MLSPDSRSFLSTLLPPTAFCDYQSSIEPYHPSASSATCVNPGAVYASPGPSSSNTLEISVFADPHFLAAAHTFQDHIYSNWRSDAHVDRVKQYEKGVCDGSLSAPWKDEVWERNNNSTKLLNGKYAASWSAIPESSARAGCVSVFYFLLQSSSLTLVSPSSDAAEVKLVDLAGNHVVLVGDVIAYKRHFINLDLVVEKDVIVRVILIIIHQSFRAL
jgi:hypothetical protein